MHKQQLLLAGEGNRAVQLAVVDEAMVMQQAIMDALKDGHGEAVAGAEQWRRGRVRRVEHDGQVRDGAREGEGGYDSGGGLGGGRGTEAAAELWPCRGGSGACGTRQHYRGASGLTMAQASPNDFSRMRSCAWQISRAMDPSAVHIAMYIGGGSPRETTTRLRSTSMGKKRRLLDSADDTTPQPSQPLAVGGGDRHDAHAAVEQRAAHDRGHAAAVAEEEREAALRKERKKELKRLKREKAHRDAAAVADVESEEAAPNAVSKEERRGLKRVRKAEISRMDAVAAEAAAAAAAAAADRERREAAAASVAAAELEKAAQAAAAAKKERKRLRKEREEKEAAAEGARDAATAAAATAADRGREAEEAAQAAAAAKKERKRVKQQQQREETAAAAVVEARDAAAAKREREGKEAAAEDARDVATAAATAAKKQRKRLRKEQERREAGGAMEVEPTTHEPPSTEAIADSAAKKERRRLRKEQERREAGGAVEAGPSARELPPAEASAQPAPLEAAGEGRMGHKGKREAGGATEAGPSTCGQPSSGAAVQQKAAGEGRMGHKGKPVRKGEKTGSEVGGSAADADRGGGGDDGGAAAGPGSASAGMTWRQDFARRDVRTGMFSDEEKQTLKDAAERCVFPEGRGEGGEVRCASPEGGGEQILKDACSREENVSHKAQGITISSPPSPPHSALYIQPPRVPPPQSTAPRSAPPVQLCGLRASGCGSHTRPPGLTPSSPPRSAPYPVTRHLKASAQRIGPGWTRCVGGGDFTPHFPTLLLKRPCLSLPPVDYHGWIR